MGNVMKLKTDNDVQTSVENDDESIMIWQSDDPRQDRDLVMLFNAKMARKFIKAIRESAKELGWEV